MKSLLSLSFILVFNLFCFGQQTHVVTNLNDNGPGSLRQLVRNSVDGDTLEFDNALLSNGSDTLYLDSVIQIEHGLSIRGKFSGGDTIYLSGKSTSQIFYADLQLSTGVDFYLTDLAIIDARKFTQVPAIYSTNGGAIMAWGLNKFELNNVLFRRCKVTGSGTGGAMSLREIDTLILRQCSFQHNSTSNSSGPTEDGAGGALVVSNCYMMVDHCSFDDNSAADRGGAINCFRTDFILKNSRFNRNVSGLINLSSPVQYGGAICFAGTGDFFVDNCYFGHNRAKEEGGAISLLGTSQLFEINNCTFEENLAEEEGGAISANDYNLLIRNSTFLYNRSLFWGGAIEASDSSLTMINCTLYNNSANTGAAISVFNTPVSLLNCTIRSIGPQVAPIETKGWDVTTVEVKGCILSTEASSNTLLGDSTTLVSNGFNIFSDSAAFVTSTDFANVPAVAIALLPPSLNGGKTLTMLPDSTSIALNSGDPSDYSYAQNLPVFGVREIGAAERGVIQYDTSAICGSYMWRGVTYNSTGTFADTVYGGPTLDSLFVLHLYELESEVINIDAILYSSENISGATYQWLNCDSGYSIIPGANALSFQPISNGNYAVIVTKDQCSDTSSCYLYQEASSPESQVLGDRASSILVYPNPSKQDVTIELAQESEDFTVSLLNSNGQLLLQKTESGRRTTIARGSLPNGFYIVRIEFNGRVHFSSIIFQ